MLLFLFSVFVSFIFKQFSINFQGYLIEIRQIGSALVVVLLFVAHCCLDCELGLGLFYSWTISILFTTLFNFICFNVKLGCLMIMLLNWRWPCLLYLEEIHATRKYHKWLIYCNDFWWSILILIKFELSQNTHRLNQEK